jgi:integrase
MVNLTKSTFNQYLRVEELSPRTIELYTFLFPKIDAAFGSLEEPDNKTIKTFLKEHQRSYWFAALKFYFEYRYDVNIVKPGHKKARAVKPTKDRTPPSFKELEKAYLKIESKLGEPEKLIIQLRAHSGRRIAEVLMLKGSDINFESNRLLFKLKGGGVGETPLTPELKKLLENYIRDYEILGAEFLFYARHLNPKTKSPERAKYNQFRDNLEKIDSEFAKLFIITHDIRRAVISKLIMDKSIAHANAWVDHESLETTNQYASKLVKDKLKDESLAAMT